MRILRVLIRLILISAFVVVTAGIVLVQFFGLRVELGGTGMTPVFSFHDPDGHYEAIEEARQAQGDTAEAAAPSASGGVYWTDFRGPNRDGIYAEAPLTEAWPENGPEEIWRQKIGGGYASVVVAEGRVFTIEQRRDNEVVAAYDAATGRQLWEHGWPARFSERLGGDGPRATPTWHEGRLYALGAAGELRCLDAASGEKIWSKNILADNDASNLTWGVSGAPLIVDDALIVTPGGRNGNSIVAYHKATGETLWRSQSDKQGYASPVLGELAGRRQILVFSGNRLKGLAPEDGALLWEHPWETSNDINSAQPVFVDADHVWVSSAYGHGAALLKISAIDGDFRAEKLWEKNTMKAKFNPVVLYQDHIYGLDDGILACIDVRSGQRKWKGGRYGFGQLLLAGSNLILISEQGELVLIKATPESHQELASFQALEGKTWNNPAIADQRLIVRNQTEMAAYDLAP